MKRWHWWLIGVVMTAGALALLIVFWPKVYECGQRYVERGRQRRHRIAPGDEGDDFAEAA
ncbi:MAG TPA: hypothetical protein VGB22_10655 [candidate division Zixibacteria bacterium]|jgi:hypothetical protein